MALLSKILLLATIIQTGVAQLSGRTGPTTSTASKRAIKICNILQHGGVASKTVDNGPAIAAAWAACQQGGEVYIPKGEYGLSTWVLLKNGKSIAFNIEGTIFRTGTAGGNMIFIRDSDDLEIYSGTAAGAIQGSGFEFHKDGKYGPRILRLYKCTNFSIHDIALVDAPQFHLTLDTSTNGEVYNVIVHGGYLGGLDGIDVWGSNIWIHDVEVSNKDECVTVKSPADHILVESVHCNWSGGCAMGSLAADTQISNIEYKNIYTHHSNQMYMIKSNGGSGNVSSVTLNNFIGHSNAYTLNVDTAWSKQSVAPGDGIEYSDIKVTNWKGTCLNGKQRAAIKVICPAKVPCVDVSIRDMNIWTETGNQVLQTCANAFGSGYCLNPSPQHSEYTKTLTVTTAPDYAHPTMANELKAGFDVSQAIPIPQIPASFFPGVEPKSAVLSRVGAAQATPVASK